MVGALVKVLIEESEHRWPGARSDWALAVPAGP